MLRHLLILPLCLWLTLASAVNLDSLWGVWNDKSQPDTNRLNAIDKIVWEGYLNSKPDSALFFAGLMYELAEQKENKKWMAKAFHYMAATFHKKREYKNVEEYYVKALEFYEEINDAKGQGLTYHLLANLYLEQSQYKKSLQYFNKSLIFAEQANDRTGMANSYNDIGLIHYMQGNYTETLSFFNKCLEIKEEIRDVRGIMIVNSNISSIYASQENYDRALMHLDKSCSYLEEAKDKRAISGVYQSYGNIYQLQGKLDLALEHFMKSLKEIEETKDNWGLASCYFNIGNLLNEMLEYDKAVEYLGNSIKISKEIGDKQGLAKSYTRLSSIDFQKGNVDGAIDWGLQGLNLAQEVGAVLAIRNASDVLYKAYKSSGQLEKALKMHELYLRMNDSINSKENKGAAIKVEYEHQYEKEQALADAKHQEELALSAEREKRQELIAWSAGGGLLLVVAFAFFIFNRLQVTRRQKKVIEEQKELVEKQKEERERMMQEIHHRVKNNMQIVKSLLGLQAGKIDDKKTKDMFKECQSRITAMATIHENMYQSEELVRIDIDHYLKVIVEKIAYSYQMDKEITYNLNIPTIKFGSRTLVPLGLIINEIMTNSYKYAFKDRESGEITLEVKEINNNEYQMIIGDNGIGMPMDFVHEESNSLGTELVHIFTEQLEGTIERIKQAGTMFKITFIPQDD